MKAYVFWLCFFHTLSVCIAAPKRSREAQPEKAFLLAIPPLKSQKQRQNEEDLGEALKALFHNNKISAAESFDILDKCRKCGLEFKNPVKDTFNSTNKPEKEKEPGEAAHKNASRTLKRFMRKNKRWGHFYWCQIPMWFPKTKSISLEWLPFLLPHEWLTDYMYQKGAKEEAMPEKGTYTSQRLAEATKAWKEPLDTMIPVGLHGDGVPIQGRMNQSTLDFWTVNLPASEKWGSQRVPICCLETKYNGGAETCQAICQVIAWSLERLGSGIFPSCRHDGSAFLLTSDKERMQWAGKVMPAKAALIQIRSDWDWNMKWLGAPAPNQKVGCCWLCAAKPDTWKAESIEQRKKQSLRQADWLASLEGRGKKRNPLFDLPGVTNWTMLPDWMHVVDEGCGALCAGQVLWEILDEYKSGNQEDRCKELWFHIQTIYEACSWPAEKKLPKLSLKDFKKPGKAAELDVKAAQCRHFVPILPILTKDHNFHQGTRRQQAIHHVANYCAKMYLALENGQCQAIASNGYKFVSQYLALESHAVSKDADDAKTWRARPKLHLLQHILDEACKGLHPKDVWNYRDETFAGTIQKLWFRRAGSTPGPSNEAEKLLLRWSNGTEAWSLERAEISSLE